MKLIQVLIATLIFIFALGVLVEVTFVISSEGNVTLGEVIKLNIPTLFIIVLLSCTLTGLRLLAQNRKRKDTLTSCIEDVWQEREFLPTVSKKYDCIIYDGIAKEYYRKESFFCTKGKYFFDEKPSRFNQKVVRWKQVTEKEL